MTRTPRRATIRDVAAAARVSPSTVSHALSGHRKISAATRARVLAAVAELGYTPDPQARSMRTGKSGMIGLVLRPHLGTDGTPQSYETFNRLTGAMAVTAVRAGMGLVHMPSVDERKLSAFPIDGCIVAHPDSKDPILHRLLSQGLPVVCADPDPARPGVCPEVRVDYRRGVTELLSTIRVAQGADVWLLLGAEDNAWTLTSKEIVSRWAAEKGVRLLTHRSTEYLDAVSATEELTNLLADRPETPAAVIYARSDLTESVMSALTQHGLSVPGDVQLATLTDSVHSRLPSIGVTAMDLNQEALAQAAVEQMLRVLADPSSHPEPILVEPAINVRGSTPAHA